MHLATLALDAAVPDDLDGRLHAQTSLSVAEMHRQLGGFCMAGTLARALLPFLDPAPARHDLARQIAAAGVHPVREEIRALYASILEARASNPPVSQEPAAPAAPPPPPAMTVADYCDRYMAGEGRDDPAMLEFAVNNGEAIEAEFVARKAAEDAAAHEAEHGRPAKRVKR